MLFQLRNRCTPCTYTLSLVYSLQLPFKQTPEHVTSSQWHYSVNKRTSLANYACWPLVTGNVPDRQRGVKLGWCCVVKMLIRVWATCVLVSNNPPSIYKNIPSNYSTVQLAGMGLAQTRPKYYHMWQLLLVKIEDYSVAHFRCIATFKVQYHQTSTKGGAYTCFTDA